MRMYRVFYLGNNTNLIDKSLFYANYVSSFDFSDISTNNNAISRPQVVETLCIIRINSR